MAATILFSTIAGTSTAIGALLVRWRRDFTRRNAVPLIALSVGVLLGNAFLELLPEAAARTSHAFPVALGAVAGLFLVEQAMLRHLHEGMHSGMAPPHDESRVHALMATAAIGVHSLIDGVVIGTAFAVSSALGLLASFAVCAHEVPEGVFTYTLLLHAGTGARLRTLLVGVVTLATPLGALGTALVVRGLSAASLGALVALSAGTFIYVGGSDLLPEVQHSGRRLAPLMVLLGITWVWLLGRVLHV